MTGGSAVFFTALLKYGVPALIVIGLAAIAFYYAMKDR